MANLKSILDGTGIALEKQAADSFGAVVDDFTRSGIPAFGIPAQPGTGAEATAAATAAARADANTWIASSYAAALAGANSYRPKLKFLFKVEFGFKSGVLESLQALAPSEMTDRLKRNEFTFMIKSVDRPKVDFEYEDEINQYNFRTKVLKKIRHRELTVTFMDDTGNRVFDFFRIMMMIHSPITRRQMEREGTDKRPESSSINGSSGMAFDTPTARREFSAHRSVVDTTNGAPLEYIRVKQMYLSANEQNLAGGPAVVTFDFMNPRIVNFDLDDLNHETSEVNLLTMQFDYDWMEMVQQKGIKESPSPQYNITTTGVVGAPSDVSIRPGVGDGNLPNSGSTNPFAAIIARQAQRAVQTTTATAISRAVSSVAGNGTFARSVAGTLSGAIAGPQGALSRSVGGLVGASSQSFLSTASTSFNNGYTTAVRPIINDPTTAGADSATVTVAPGGG